MKTYYRINLLAAAVVALSVVGQATAQYKPTGAEGITASPKVRAQLEDRKARLNTTPAVATTMACPKCQDEYVTVPLRGAKGAQILLAGGTPTQKIARHLCRGCDTTITLVGNSKATRHSVATHTCTGCGAEIASCCSSKGGSEAATKGMEKKSVEIGSSSPRQAEK